MIRPSKENIAAVTEHFKRMLENEPVPDFAKEALDDLARTPEDMRRLYAVFCSAPEKYGQMAHDMVGCGAYGLATDVFKSGYWAAVFERAGLRKDGRAIDIGGPSKVFATALSILGFKGEYIPVEIDRKELKARAKYLGYLGLDIQPANADALHRTIRDGTCDLILYNHVIDDLFRGRILREYHDKRREGLPKFSEHPFQRLWEEAELFKRRHAEEFREERFWQRLEKDLERKPHLKIFFYETLAMVENAVLDSCNVLKKGGFSVLVQYRSGYDERTPQIDWSNVVLPKLAKTLLEQGNFLEEARSGEDKFAHPWYLLKRK